ncbi:MAG: PAS domain S-box protein [Chloroflexota bacterium]|nr:MAG: PAS domain S-box protein [Chloroflexota bacterium]
MGDTRLKKAYDQLEQEILERKRAEEKLRAAKEELETRIAERTFELRSANEQLQVELAERKQAEKEREQFFNFFQISPDIMVIAEPDGAFRKVNPAALELLGYAEAELVSRPFIDFVHPDDKQLTLDEMAQQKRVGSSLNFENRYVCKDGTSRWLSWRANYYANEGTTYATARDITDRKRAEEELAKYREHLEELVKVRTAQSEQSKQQAEAANQAKSLFLANMSHELRTPMNAILGFSGLMRSDPDATPGQRDNLDIISRSGEHLLDLIDKVLEMAKIEAGRMAAESAPCDMGAIIRDVTELMGERAREKGLELSLDEASTFPRFVTADAAKLRQILINLVGNAVKFTQQGHVTLRLSSTPTDDPHLRRLVIEVEDTGVGIAWEDQSRIFEPFVQVGTAGTQKGTGLGLAISRQYTELMDGAISVHSSPGAGSLFRVDLPVQLATESQVLKTQVDTGTVLALQPGQPAYRILIVEDQLDNQLLLRRLLEGVGFRVQAANNGAEGIELFRTWHPHFIWMDRRMPVMDGLEATRRIRALDGGRDVKIVSLTASVFYEQRDEVLAAGTDDLVRKPYHAEEIFDCLAEHLGVRYLREEPVTPLVEDPSMTLGPAVLAPLPTDLRRELQDALIRLDTKRISGAIDLIASQDTALGALLARYAARLDYTAILHALQSDEGAGP